MGSSPISMSCTHLSWVLPLHALHWHPLWSGPRVPLLGHPLAVAPEGPHALGSWLVHAHRRASHAGSTHAPATPHGAAWVHAAGSHGGGASRGALLVHELAPVALVGCHLKRGRHL